MKLSNLFEQTTSNASLAPGEKRERTDLQARDLKAIQAKIDDLRYSLHKSERLSDMFQQDTELQASLENLKKRIDLKIEYLYRMKNRPSKGVAKMFDILDRECSEFLPYMKTTGKILLRGLRTDVSVFEGRSRLDREPKDSRTEISNRLDQALRNEGFQALRSNSIFTTTSYSFANSYGKHLYCIFPKNGFHVLTTNVRDLILNSYDVLVGPGWMDGFKDLLRKYLEDNVPDWQKTNLGYELKFESWSAMFYELKKNFDEGNPLKLPEEFNKVPADLILDQDIIKYLEPRQDDLENAMADGREILINGEYWALKLSSWKEHIVRHYLEGNSPF